MNESDFTGCLLMTPTLYNIYVYLRECCEILRLKIWENEEAREAYYRKIRTYSSRYLELMQKMSQHLRARLDDLSIRGTREIGEAHKKLKESLRRKAERRARRAEIRERLFKSTNFLRHHKILSCPPEPDTSSSMMSVSLPLTSYSPMALRLLARSRPALYLESRFPRASSMDWMNPFATIDIRNYYGNDLLPMDDYDDSTCGLELLSGWDLLPTVTSRVRRPNRCFLPNFGVDRIVRRNYYFTEEEINAIKTCINILFLTPPSTEGEKALQLPRKALRSHMRIFGTPDRISINEYVVFDDTDMSDESNQDIRNYQLDESVQYTFTNRFGSKEYTVQYNTYIKIREDATPGTSGSRPKIEIVELDSDDFSDDHKNDDSDKQSDDDSDKHSDHGSDKHSKDGSDKNSDDDSDKHSDDDYDRHSDEDYDERSDEDYDERSDDDSDKHSDYVSEKPSDDDTDNYWGNDSDSNWEDNPE